MESESTTYPLALDHLDLDLDLDNPEHVLTMDDIHTTTTPGSPALSSFTTPAPTQCSPPPVVVTSKPAKKRKSWGQELPQPKTNLPPRKRAKTDDEKEQRRIERIKRNRAAAHNSRERKRQETETLAVALARANAELEAYRKLHGPLPASVVLPEVHLCTEGFDETSPSYTASTPAPSLVESHGSQLEAPSPSSPADSVFPASAHSAVKQEAPDNSCSFTLPPDFESLDDVKSSLLTLDPTQHSAAMLCDLQCRSSRMSSGGSSSSNSSSSNTISPWPISWWAHLCVYLMASQMQTCYKTLLLALWTLSPSRMARLMQASTLRSTSRSTTSSTTLQLLRSTSRRLALSSTATGLSAPQKGASALRQQSVVEEPRSKDELAAARHAQTPHPQMVLSEQILGRGAEDASMGDDGDENGVRRGERLYE